MTQLMTKVPIGTILPIVRSQLNISTLEYFKRHNFYLCDGSQIPENLWISNSILRDMFKNRCFPDLRSRALIGASKNDELPKTGGQEDVTLKKDNLPLLDPVYVPCEKNNVRFPNQDNGWAHPIKASQFGNENPASINIMQPYYCVYYFVYVGNPGPDQIHNN